MANIFFPAKFQGSKFIKNNETVMSKLIQFFKSSKTHLLNKSFNKFFNMFHREKNQIEKF